jgi:EAL domain-containing protein (putative c-di-GMP-specific phosphodiesterase class I)/DNA-binding NarL/FixJ family response regulator
VSGAGVNGPEMISEALIYIADDEPANRLLLERILARGGYTRVLSFPDGKSLLTACEEEEPDLVLADLRMPGVDGFGVLESLRRESADGYLPVVILTAEPNRDARKRALSLGAADFLGKPFDFDEVLLRSRNLIETRLLHAALATRIVNLGDEVEARGREINSVTSERAAIAASLDRVSAFDTPESIAAALCADLATAIDVRHVTLLIFEASDRAVSFVAHNARSSADVGYALPADRSLELWERASVGAWVEEIVARPERGADGERLAASGWRSAIYAPVRSGGRLFGILSAGTPDERPAERLARDLPSVVDYATLCGALLGRTLALRQQASDVRHSLETVIAQRAFRTVFQPILEIGSSKVVGHEALTRFDDGVPPDQRFANATTVGLGLDLEFATLRVAIEGSRGLPSDTWLSVNVSPTAALAGEPLARLLRQAHQPVVLELTEHTAVHDYPALRQAIVDLGPGIRVAVDDAGAGYASMQHVVEVRPDLVKLDISLVRGIDGDPARQALIAGMRYFAEETRCIMLGEGVETTAELKTLQRLGVVLGQGYLLGRPGPPSGRIDGAAPRTRRSSSRMEVSPARRR